MAIRMQILVKALSEKRAKIRSITVTEGRPSKLRENRIDPATCRLIDV